ncbi:hypothetical protein AMAG_10614 [Allomyces macrogynus ATCC 38327]|uniref:Uncharacterized protein n=1 Tax=Allomyces macrogynus (strain ATCC 38327) TaxID=578462 RepID=A0A0L0SRG3_ALLM3|nr:hypothetical protein AMAG_10614 [Allomyces macrogynus ATCC 38327]|eukprot:KNE64949.1 hypothetical protein AMAG_10614 [Allomyces macrogynus ATCC 38327]
MTLHERAPIELLPFVVIDNICVWLTCVHQALLPFAISSPAFFAPAISTALRHGRGMLEPLPDDTEPIELDGYLGDFLVPAHHDRLFEAVPRNVYLVLPPRNDNCSVVLASSRQVTLPQFQAMLLPVPLHQVAHAQIRFPDLASLPMPLACRCLTVESMAAGWALPAALHSLKLTEFEANHDTILAIVALFPETLRELTIELIGDGDDRVLTCLHDHLPPLLTVFKVVQNEGMFFPNNVGDNSSAALANALAKLLHLTTFRHDFLRFDGVVHVLNGLAAAQGAGRARPLCVVDLRARSPQFLPAPPVFSSAVHDLRLAHLGLSEWTSSLDEMPSDIASRLLDFMLHLPRPTQSLQIDFRTWPVAVMLNTRVVQHFASQTLRSLSFVGPFRSDRRLSWFSAFTSVDKHFPALKSLTIEGCLFAGSIATCSNLGSLPPTLRILDLSCNSLTTADAAALWPCLPAGLSDLRLASNDLTTIPTPLPPSLRVLQVPCNENLGGSVALWIDALPPTLRHLDVRGCNLPEGAGRVLHAVGSRAGVRRLSGALRLQVKAIGNGFEWPLEL